MRAAYVQASRRPQDGRYGDNPNRLQHYYQFQAVLKLHRIIFRIYFCALWRESASKPLKTTFALLKMIGNLPHWALGVGLGSVVKRHGSGTIYLFSRSWWLAVKPVLGEITYGLERLAMFIQGKDNVFDLQWTEKITYGALFRQNEKEQSIYNFERADTAMLLQLFDFYEKESSRLVTPDNTAENKNAPLPLPAYELTMKCSHIFNLLDARGVISVTERARYVARVRNLARRRGAYLESRRRLGFPLQNNDNSGK